MKLVELGYKLLDTKYDEDSGVVMFEVWSNDIKEITINFYTQYIDPRRVYKQKSEWQPDKFECLSFDETRAITERIRGL